MAKSSIWLFCLSGTMLVLILKFAILDTVPRRQRICQESRALAILSERQKQPQLAAQLYNISLKESNGLAKDDLRVAFTHADLGAFQLKSGNCKAAELEFDRGAETLKICKNNIRTTPEKALNGAEMLRIELLRARSLVCQGKLEEARGAYLHALHTFNQSCVRSSPDDLLSLVRVKEAFSSYCVLIERLSITQSSGIEELQAGLNAVPASGRLSEMPDFAKIEMGRAMEKLLDALGANSIVKIQLEKVLQAKFEVS